MGRRALAGSCWLLSRQQRRALAGSCWLLSRQQQTAEQVRSIYKQWTKPLGSSHDTNMLMGSLPELGCIVLPAGPKYRK